MVKAETFTACDVFHFGTAPLPFSFLLIIWYCVFTPYVRMYAVVALLYVYVYVCGYVCVLSWSSCNSRSILFAYFNQSTLTLLTCFCRLSLAVWFHPVTMTSWSRMEPPVYLAQELVFQNVRARYAECERESEGQSECEWEKREWVRECVNQSMRENGWEFE